MTARSCFIAATTFASPTAVRRTVAPKRPATSSSIRDVLRFVTSTRAPASLPLSTAIAPSASVYSSPMYRPCSSMIASRSASGSCAKPMSAPASRTASARPPGVERFSAVGSGAWGKMPESDVFRARISAHPSASSSCGAPVAPDEFTQSTATRSPSPSVSGSSQSPASASAFMIRAM
jgi:hypothetical protein